MTLSSRGTGAAGAVSRRGLLLAGSLICVPSLGRAAGRKGHWRMWIDQGGARTEIVPEVTREIRLKRQPFTLGFQGPRDWAYLVMACEDPADVAGKDLMAVLEVSTNAFKRFAESNIPVENTHLCVNRTGVIAADSNGMHVWGDEPAEDEHDFTRFTPDGTGSARAERDIDTILLIDRTGHDDGTPIENTTLATISLIVAGVKPVHRFNFAEPLSFTIVFE